MNKENLIKLKEAMETEQKINEVIAIKKEEFEKENSDLFMTQAKIRETIAYCKDVARENAESGYNKDGLKKRLGGIGIRIMVDLDFNKDEAFEWAKQHDLCLQLDEKEFKKIAKTQDIPFVKKEERVCVTFPKQMEEL